MYSICIKQQDDVEVEQATCRSPLNCNCSVDPETVCGYDRHTTQQRVAEHYFRKARAILEMTNEQFMSTHGYYFDERD